MAEIISSRPGDELAVERVVTERLNERGEPLIQIMDNFLDQNLLTFKTPVTPIWEWHRHEVQKERCLSQKGLVGFIDLSKDRRA